MFFRSDTVDCNSTGLFCSWAYAESDDVREKFAHQFG